MTALGKEFIKDVGDVCFQALGDLGIKKRRQGIGSWDIRDEFHGWIGLNAATRWGDGTMTIKPFIGVRYDPIHRIVAEVEGMKYEASSPPTICRYLGHLTPAVPLLGFEFVKGGDIASTARDLRDCVQAAGIPFAEELASLKTLVERIPLDCPWDYAGERLLVALYLLGDLDSIEPVIAERHKQGQSMVVNLEGFDEFAEKFLKYIERRK